MRLNTEDLVDAMTAAGQDLAAGVWSNIRLYAVPELRMIAEQIVAIGKNIADYTVDGAKALLAMQVDAAIAVIAAATEITLIKIQKAIASILSAVRDMVNEALPIPLL